MNKLLENLPLSIPGSARFGAVRKFDIHCGVDFHCPEGTKVFALEAGIVKKVKVFTGPKVNSPWWEETFYIGILSDSGYLVYGEVSPLVEEGQVIKAGELIALVAKVLKKDKGAPTAMLHLEWYAKEREEPAEWKLTEPQPTGLKNVELILNEFTYLFEA